MTPLQEALRRAQDERDRGRGLEVAPRPAPPIRVHAPAPVQGQAPSPLYALGLTALIFGAALTAWHTMPELSTLPAHKPAIPGELKLDYELDLSRKGGATQSSLPGRAR